MTASANVQSARAGLKNTLRFSWVMEGQDLPDRLSFGVEILFGSLGLEVGDIYCMQRNIQEKYYDVSFLTLRLMEDVKGRANATLEGHEKWRVESLCKNNQRVVTVHSYNPWVTEETLRYFLSRYTTVLPGVREIRDALGIWTGTRQFRVLLKDDPDGYEGYVHPPAVFTVGADRGYLFYANQPRFCRKCNTYGHVADSCNRLRCRNCDGYGHATKECDQPKRCSLCGSTEHLFRQCPKDSPSYALAVRGHRGKNRHEKEVSHKVAVPSKGQVTGEDAATRGVGEETPVDSGLIDIETVLRGIQEVLEETEHTQTETEMEQKEPDQPEGTMISPGIAPEKPISWSEQVETTGEDSDVSSSQSTEWTTVVGEKKRKRKKRKTIRPTRLERQAPGENRFSVLTEEDHSEEKMIMEKDVRDTHIVDDPPQAVASTVMPPSGIPVSRHSQEEQREEEQGLVLHGLFSRLPLESSLTPGQSVEPNVEQYIE